MGFRVAERYLRLLAAIDQHPKDMSRPIYGAQIELRLSNAEQTVRLAEIAKETGIDGASGSVLISRNLEKTRHDKRDPLAVVMPVKIEASLPNDVLNELTFVLEREQQRTCSVRGWFSFASTALPVLASMFGGVGAEDLDFSCDRFYALTNLTITSNPLPLKDNEAYTEGRK